MADSAKPSVDMGIYEALETKENETKSKDKELPRTQEIATAPAPLRSNGNYERLLRVGGDREAVQAATDQSLKETNRNVTWLVAVGVGLFLTTYVYMGIWEYIGESISRRIRAAYLRSVLRQDITWHDEHGAGKVTGGIETDTHHIQGGISEKVPLAVMYISTFFAGFVIAFTQNWRLALVLAATMVPTIGAAGIVMEMVMSKFKTLSMKELAVASSMVEEVFSGIRAVQAFGSEQKLAKLFDTIDKRAMEYDLKST
ncbi:hypothetical protein QFC21_007309 [Naganishia friedmannii]|uniref:Uncharacterized protein n=1 Tax=Naganishia friedmannii TaxID=89922 RepID=A0ACC2UVR7_9TREE|nr:hypothetical protein QFC21_007309 [Naganishia friedmannii]